MKLQETAEVLYKALMREKWDKVLEMYSDHPEIQALKIADMVQPKHVSNQNYDTSYDSNETALHWAITNKAPDSMVVNLIDRIAKTDRALETLKVMNSRGDTPLHCAATRGSTIICRHITDINKLLVRERNEHGETPLFLAALNGHPQTFLYLHAICREVEPNLPSSLWKKNNGDTILHCTIRRKHFDLSYKIIELYEAQNIGSCFNTVGDLPLNELVMIPSAFKNGCRLKWWQKLLYHFFQVEMPKCVEYQYESSSTGCQTQAKGFPGSVVLFMFSARTLQGSLRKLKENHVLGALIMEELVKQDPWYRDNDNAKEMEKIVNMKYYPLIDMEIQEGRIKRSTALLIAAKNGLVEQVIKILTDIPVSVHDQLLIEKRNIVHVAVVERQSRVLEEVKKHELWHVLREKVDADRNNALHLAAHLSKHTTWEIRGSVMQMQWEITWFEYMKKSMPPYFISQTNNNGKTPGEIFANEHKQLLMECNKSVKDTCGSYIVAATLIIGNTFSACYQAPGELGQTFSVSLLISFCFSITSLAAFLSIYSTRTERPKGFRRILPLNLCLGFFSFCASLLSMLVSFFAALSHDLGPEKKCQFIISYGVILLPAAAIYSFAQIPLFLDLLIGSLLTNVPQPRIVEEDNTSPVFHDSGTEHGS